MRRLIYGEDDRLLAYAHAHIPHSHFTPDAKGIGVELDGILVGAFIFNDFSSTGCFMSVASDRSGMWLGRRPRDVLTPVFAYPFIQCGKQRVSAVVSEHNTRSLRFVRALGATEEGRLREAAATGEDVILFGMLRRECRWL